MKKMDITLSQYVKYYSLVTILCSFSLNIGQAQAEMSLWYIPTTKHTNTPHQHGGNELLIPCGWNYYHRYDSESRIIEYGIRNEGDAPLTLSLPLAFEDGSSFEFVIMEQPSKAVLQPGEDIHFKVKYIALGAYQPAQATLKIPNDAPNSSNCTLEFGVGGFPPPLPFDPSFCLKKTVSTTDFNADNTTDRTYTTTRTLDDRNNILESVEVVEDETGAEIGRFTIVSTYSNTNQLLTENATGSGIFGFFITSTTITNTYDANDNLIKEVVAQTGGFGINTVTNEHTYDANNRRTATKRTTIAPFGLMDMTDITYTYDANGNLLMETAKEGGTNIIMFTIMNTYDANNNLLTSEEDFVGLFMIKTTNTYDANNRLLSSVIEDSGFVTSKTTTTNTYNSFGQIMTQVIVNEDNFSPNDLIQSFTFTYDANQRLISRAMDFNRDGFPVSLTERTAVTPCDLPIPSIADPCNCGDPLNKKNKDSLITHFHDVLTVTGTPGQTVILQTGNTNFLDNNLVQIADGTNLGTIPASGVLNHDFFHASGASGAITLNVGGVLTNPFSISVCSAKNCVVIPTMSQWGLLIFGLLILNLSLLVIYRLKPAG